jgi:allantoinase
LTTLPANFSIRGRRVLLAGADAPQSAKIFVRDGKIESIVRGWVEGSCDIDAGDALVMAGIVDTHAHINEPGRTEWEGFTTATRAAAAGGITTVVDMPLNSIPPTTSVSALQTKASSAQSRCLIDYGFWGGVVPGNASELDAMVEQGVLGFKAFMIESGVDEFQYSREGDLREAMPILARAGVPLLVHAEVDCGAHVSGSDTTQYDRYVQSRPPKWEVEAIRQVIKLSRETGCRVHVVHLSAAEALDDIRKAKAEGVLITVETCPHYLSLVAEEIPAGATHFKCAPPIRGRQNCEKLWNGLQDGSIDFVVSDHSPCTPQLKKMESGDFDQAWGGIAGLQFSLSIVWTEMKRRGLSVALLSQWMSERTARFAGLSNKGKIAPGFDADFVIWDPEKSFQVEASKVYHRHSLTPYLGKKLYGSVLTTIVRGQKVYDQGEFAETPRGLWVVRDLEKGASFMNQEISSLGQAVHVPFTELPDLLSEKMGGRALLTNDDFFASKDNLVLAAPPVFIPGKYTEFGKWMDGWESRRKRNLAPGNDHDWCILALGTPGVIRGVDVDTAFFTGNYPESCAIDACVAADDESAMKSAKWKEILPQTRLRGGSHNLMAIADEGRWTHLRLRIIPDGGVARLRVYGEVRPDWDRVRASREGVDLAAVVNGGEVITCNDMFFGSKENLILPGRAKTMGEGWETKRKRGPGHDWIIVRLATTGSLKKIEVDTNHFKGNYPDCFSIDACAYAGRNLTASDFRDRTDIVWKEIIPRTKLQASHQHFFEGLEVATKSAKYDYVRLNIYPDGGVSRLRVWGTPA